MTNPKHDDKPARLTGRAFLIPIAWIAALVASYLVLADWQTLPALMSSAVAAI